MASKAFFSIEFQGGAELIRELSAVELELKKVQDQIKAAQKAGDNDAYKNLRVQQEDLKRSSAELRDELKQQANSFQKIKPPSGSLLALEQEYARLRKEIKGFSKDYRESVEGSAKINLAESLKSQILEVEKTLRSQEDALKTASAERQKQLKQQEAERKSQLKQQESELKKQESERQKQLKQQEAERKTQLKKQEAELKKQEAELKKQLKQQEAEFQKSKFPKDSLIGLEQEYSKLRAEIRGFSKDYRESAAGIAKIRLADSLKSQILEIDNSIKDFKSNIGNYKSGLSSLSNVGDIITGGLVTGGITAAIGAVVAFGKESVAAFKESEIAITAVATAVTTTGKAAGFTVEQLAQEAENLMKNTVFDDDQILKDVTSQLLTFTNVTGDTFLRAQKSALDLNTVLGGDLQGTTIQLGKALENPIKGVTALSKAGVTFTEQQKAQIKTLVESNKVQEAQAIILDEINAKYGNQAEALANTPTGRLKQLSNIFGELQEKVGQFVVNGLAKIAPFVSGLIEGISTAFTYLYDYVLEPIGVAFSRLFDVIFEGAGKSEILNKVMNYLAVAFSAVGSILTTVINNVSDTIEWFRKLGQDVPAVGFVFEKVRERVSSFVDLLTNIPALLAAVLKGFAQFVNNVRNFDFSKSSIAVGVEEFKKITEQRKIEEKKVEVKAQGAKSPTNGLAEKQAANDKEAKAAEDQQKRIEELKKKIRDLSAKDIANEFDRQIAQAKDKAADELAKLEAEKKKIVGKKDSKSLQEAKLIDQETELIKSSLDNQIAGISAKRQAAYDAANEQLAKAQAENLKIVQDANAKAAKASIDNINAEAEIRIAEINGRYEKEISALADSLENRNITQEQYDKALAGIEANRSEEVLDAEKSLSESRLLLYKQYLQAKLALVDAGAQAELVSLDIAVDKEKEALTKKLADGLIQEKQYSDQLSEIDKNYAAKQKAIEADATNEKKALNNAFTKQVIDNNGKQAESTTTKTQKDIDAEKESAEIRKAIIDGSLQLAGELSDALFSAAQDNADREKEAKLKALDDEYEKKFEAAKGNATLEAGLKKQLEEEKNAIEKKAFEENKKRQIAQAIINGALAITNILATVPKFDFGIASAIQVAVTAASTAIQIATIKNAKFARGGFTGFGHGAPDETGHVPVGVVHANEWVANPEMVRDNPELFQRLEFEQATKYRRATHKKLFADGGFTTNVPDVIGINKVSQQKQSAAVFSNEQMKAFAQEVAQQTYEAVKAGSMEGTKDGVYTGQNEVNRLRERQDVLAVNSTF